MKVGDLEGSIGRAQRESCSGGPPDANGTDDNLWNPPRNPALLVLVGSLWPTSSDHGDIKDACNGTSGGGFAHPRALKAVRGHAFHHARAARHLAKRQHGLHALQLALEATWRLSLHGFQID